MRVRREREGEGENPQSNSGNTTPFSSAGLEKGKKKQGEEQNLGPSQGCLGSPGAVGKGEAVHTILLVGSL